MAPDPSWDFQSPTGRARLVSVLRGEIDAMFELASDPERWHVATACPGWEIRDMIGHLVDATESYLTGFASARSGAGAPESVGVAGMARAADDAARAFRRVPREELLDRLRTDSDRLLNELESLSDADWSGLVVADRYMGPLPAMIVAAGLLGGYAVHGWDVRQGLGAPHAIDGDAADLLVPFVFLLWWATANPKNVAAPYAIGIRTTGHNGGDTRFDVSPSGLRFAAGDIGDCAAILEFDPASLLLTAFNRINGGTLHGDRGIAAGFRSLFIAI